MSIQKSQNSPLIQSLTNPTPADLTDQTQTVDRSVAAGIARGEAYSQANPITANSSFQDVTRAQGRVFELVAEAFAISEGVENHAGSGPGLLRAAFQNIVQVAQVVGAMRLQNVMPVEGAA